MISRRSLIAGAGAAAVGLAAGPACANGLGAVLRTATDPRLAAARRALALHSGKVVNHDRVAIADYTLPSRAPRFYLVDFEAGRATTYLVAHGRGSDPDHSGWVERFSNAPGSAASSDGAYLTGGEYQGKHGRSMRLEGLDPTNSNAEMRAIVVHAAWYVSPQMVQDHGKLGRSEGCFALSDADLGEVLERLGPGRLLLSGKF